VGDGGKDTEADLVIATKVTISVLNMAPPFRFMANCEVILILPDLLIVLMSRLAIFACIILFDQVFWLVGLTHLPAEALSPLEVVVVVTFGRGPGHQLIIFISDHPHHLLDNRGLIGATRPPYQLKRRGVVKDLRVLSEPREFLGIAVLPSVAFLFSVLAELSNDELLLDHLNFLVEGLQVHIVELVHVLEKDPGGGQGRPVEELHKRFHRHVNAGAVKGLERDAAEVREFLENIPRIVMGGHAPEQDGTLLSQGGRDEHEIFVGQRAQGQPLDGVSQVLVCLVSRPSTAVHPTSFGGILSIAMPS